MSEPPAASPPGDPAQIRAAVAELTHLLSGSDPASEGYLEAKQTLLRALFPGAAWPQFEKLVQNYEFGEAQARLEEAARGIGA